MMALSGVRSSWLIAARNADFERLAMSALRQRHGALVQRVLELGLGRFELGDMGAQPRRLARGTLRQVMVDDRP